MSIQSLKMMFRGAIYEWVTDVKLWEAEHKDETKLRFGPRFYRRGLLGQPKQIIKTLLGQGDLANFTEDNIIETLRNNGNGHP